MDTSTQNTQNGIIHIMLLYACKEMLYLYFNLMLESYFCVFAVIFCNLRDISILFVFKSSINLRLLSAAT